MSNVLSRRGFVKALGLAAGATLAAPIPFTKLVRSASAAPAPTEPTAVVLLHLVGGYNAIFTSASTLVGSFGVRDGNFTGLGNGLSVDDTFASSMSAFAKQHMAAVGVRHGITSHPGAQEALWTFRNANAGLVLANAIGGDAAIRAAFAGENALRGQAPDDAVAGTSFQAITDLHKTTEALGVTPPGARVPSRAIALAGVRGAEAMSGDVIAGSPRSLRSLRSGYETAVGNLQQAPQLVDVAALKAAYGVSQDAVTSLASKFAAAELMVQTGTSVVAIHDRLSQAEGWDTHGDASGNRERTLMRTRVLGPLNRFINRMVADPGRNVVLCIFGDFARSLPGSNHQPNLTATVIGKYVRKGSTGRVNADVGLPAGTPGIAGLWSYLAAVAKTPTNPFGANAHPSLA